MEEKGGPNQAGGASFSTLKRRFDGFDDHQLLQIPDDFMRSELSYAFEAPGILRSMHLLLLPSPSHA